ncbi:alpha-amylase family glycosyl hydrolase [Vibrio sinaloensis]|nr:alpha-amylase family glycosyl hydrolase [Vibrio sinaloensis]
MFDGVINHISQSSDWFQGYLKGDDKYRHFFTEANPECDYSSVTRPRALPLLTEFETAHGTKHVWTTFSADQIDLNFRTPDVFLKKSLNCCCFMLSKGRPIFV